MTDADLVTLYTDFWRDALMLLGGWSATDAATWIEERRRLFFNDTLTFHEEPMFWVTEPLVRDRLREVKGPDRALAIRRIATAVAGGRHRYRSGSAFDWDAARVRFEQAVAEVLGNG